MMGRRKTYDRDEVADKAMRLFWRKGFHATTTRDLAQDMGINAYSLYAEFGSKEGLFDAAVDRYEAIVVEAHFGALEAEGAGLQQIRDVLDFFGDNGMRDGSEVGCLLTNASTEQAPNAEAAAARMNRFVGRLQTAFARALRHAMADGRVQPTTPVDDLSRLFTTVLVGLWVLSRGRAGPEMIRGSADQALARLQEFAMPTDADDS